jgi:ATP-dependent DNA helicase RecQ
MIEMPALRDELRDRFGFDRFREGQEEAVSKLMDGRSVLAIFPTGAGKSLCYQLPALLLEGVTLVISPLIALMKDQLDFLVAKGAPAARLDSTLTREENLKLFDDLHNGRLKLLYVSPERLGNERFLRAIGRRRISLLAIDEAHCISEWGHNFRPDYLKIARLAKDLGVERTLALTATATPEVARDVRAAFGIAEEDEVHTGFHRPNLELSVVPVVGRDRRELLLERIQGRPRGATIVYVTLQRTAEEVAEFLARRGVKASAYHAGLKAEERTAIQDAFMSARDSVIVATIAFGMGVDKSDIRHVYHYNLPKGLESYSQEIGRAGRDGNASVCEMLASVDDVVTLENFSHGDTPESESVHAFAGHIFAAGETFDISEYDLSNRFDVRPLVVKTLLTYLELDGFLASTGPFYSEYKFQPQCPSSEIFARVDGEKAEFLRSVFRHAKKGTKWFTLDTAAVSESIGQPRDRIVSALGYLEEKGDLILQVAGVRQGYRRLRVPEDLDSLVASLNERFRKREENDLDRMRRVLEFASHPGCLTRHLLAYFGEALGECGHCCRCSGEAAVPLEGRNGRAISEADLSRVRGLIEAGHPSIQTPRQLARFLCGITSPATTRARLRRETDLFGVFEEIPFRQVLKRVTEILAP